MLSVIAFLAMLQTEKKPEVSPSSLISKMFAKYSAAKSMKGTIRLTVPGVPDTVVTTLQFQRTNKLYLKQVQTGGVTAERLVTSDGAKFSYPVPPNLPVDGSERLVEAVQNLGIGDIYKASSLSLLDRSTPLDIAIAHRDDLKFLTSQWATVVYRGRTKIGDKETSFIYGAWRSSQASAVSASYEMYLDDEMNLIRFVINRDIATNQGVKNVHSIWDVDLKIDAQPDANVFTVVK